MFKSYVVVAHTFLVSAQVEKPPGSFGIWVCLGLAWGLGLDLGLGFGTRA